MTEAITSVLRCSLLLVHSPSERPLAIRRAEKSWYEKTGRKRKPSTVRCPEGAWGNLRLVAADFPLD